ncbi:Ribosomal RNA-processing protein 7 [Pseudocercospora fuligena]|uniref:Ribosomal RNA-processing protein 7 n=1 Tax=Pseudocercospora fuligena TaxID=685502 RepID=A0A8H6VDP5_9PEZI|nr:Ribosomal RNA-processing protein 7 [Pseudocercospora fuligena]
MAPMPPTKVPTVVNDFIALPLRTPPVPSFPQKATHYLYLRANAPKAPTENTPREVFLVNVPVDATETHIKHLFANQLGGVRVENVAFEGARVGKGIAAPVAPVQQGKKRKRGDEEGQTAQEVGLLPETWDRDLHRSGGTAVVTFVDAASAQLSLKEARRAAKGKSEIVWGEGVKGVPALGSKRYAAHHKLRYPDHAVLQQSVDAFMTAFAAQEEAKAKALAKLRNEPDEDGFITVTRGGRQGPGREEEAKAKEEELRNREKNRIKEDFYRFQVREKKKEEAKDLVKGFEEDRKKVEEMKRRRGKFRPE